jgi:hypothetical protein
MKKLLMTLVAIVMLFTLFGCGEEPVVEEQRAITSSGNMTLYVGDTEAIVVEFTGERDTLVYSGYDAAVIKIMGGIVKAVAKGSTTVTVKEENHTDVSCTFSVTVKEKLPLNTNYSFETFDETAVTWQGWTLEKTLRAASSLTIDKSNKNSGLAAIAYWCDSESTTEDLAAESVKLSQTLTIAEAGDYVAYCSILSTNTNLVEGYFYIKCGTNEQKVDIKTVTGWNNGAFTAFTSNKLTLTANSEVEIGIYLKGGANSWYVFDDLYIMMA